MRLIDADAFASHLYGVAENYRKDFENSFAALVVEESIIYDLDYAPTIDAVPVVRCKDCKHMAIVGVGFRWCKAWERIQTMGDDGFCCFGERKDGDT